MTRAKFYQKLVDSLVDSSGIISAGLETQFNSNKKKTHIESVYFHGLSYKKPKNPNTAGGVVDSSAGLVFGNVL
ncbi:hypothetical protein G9A89_023994 [Geosiphon pyriformis]|nr:hypothetical protein G9A89_023994 [Geosiphon pyriformis]